MTQRERVQRLNFDDVRDGNYVLYWMQASQRAEWNHALEYAIDRANELGKPLLALSGITDRYPEANLRHYAFMLEGLRETQAALRQRGVQLVVRRELGMSFVYYNPRYDSYRFLPDWAQATLEEHRKGARGSVYTARQLEEAKTHDPYWNAAMREMLATGKMVNYMRMCWGKKILEWTCTPPFAFRTALRLNSKYFLDGRDPNSFAGVAWCFGKHDRPWVERPIFGKVRYMNANGLRRKFDIEAYLRRVQALGPGGEPAR